MPKGHLIIALAAAALAAGACDTLAGLFSGDDSRLAIIERATSSEVASLRNAALTVPADTGILAPDTVAVGEAFTAEIWTYEADGCWSKDRTEVQRGSLEAHVRPYNRRNPGYGGNCPDALQEIIHTAEISFGEPGDAVFEVTGLRVIDGEVEAATTVTREKMIHVR